MRSSLRLSGNASHDPYPVGLRETGNAVLMFLLGMMGAGSEVWAGCGGCRARAVLGRKGNREIGYTQFLGEREST